MFRKVSLCYVLSQPSRRNPLKTVASDELGDQINLRITDEELRTKLTNRAAANKRTRQAEILILLSRALHMEEMLADRNGGAFDLAVAFSHGGARAVIVELMTRHGVRETELAQWALTVRGNMLQRDAS
jgi:hypothetical protein